MPGPSDDPLDVPATPERLHALVLEGVLPEVALPRALALAHASPVPARWGAFTDRLAMALGAALLLAGVIYFFAFNWADLPHLARMGLLAGVLAATATGAWRFGEGPAGATLLAASAVLVGPLLATYGQAYQTGADAWELFLGWGALILPWALFARSPALWLLLLLVGNAGAVLYTQQVLDARWEEVWLLPLLAAINASAWAASEWRARRGPGPVGYGRWFPRVLFGAALLLAMPQALSLLIDEVRHAAQAVAMLLALGMSAAAVALFRGPRGDLFMVVGGVAAPCVLADVAIGRLLFTEDNEAFASLTMAFLVIAQLTVLAWWLRRQARAAAGGTR